MRTASIFLWRVFSSRALAAGVFGVAASLGLAVPAVKADVLYGDSTFQWNTVTSTVVVPVVVSPVVPVTSDPLMPPPIVTVVSSTVPTAIPVPDPVPVIPPTSNPVLQVAYPLVMADGSLYHPATGMKAPTREALEAMIEPLGYTLAASGQTPEPVRAVRPAVFDVIDRAKQMLQDEIDADHAKNPNTVYLNADDGSRLVTLAIWNKSTDQVELVHARKKGLSLTYVDQKQPIKVTVSNGLNSYFASTDGGVHQMLAIRYPIYNEETVSSKKKRYRVEDVVYVPLSAASAASQDEVVAYGRQWMMDTIEQVYGKLDQTNVHSRAFSDRAVTAVIDPKMVLSVLAIEHLDQNEIVRAGDDALNRFFMTVAFNQNQSYAFSRSGAGALGIAQFMPKTYTNLVKQNPKAGLITGFDQGMRSVQNSVLAQTMYLDSILSELPLDTREYFTQDPSEVNEYVVASYNAGPARVSKAISFWTSATKADTTQFAPLVRLDRIQQMVDERQSQIKTASVSEQSVLKREVKTLQAESDRIKAEMKAKKKPGLKQETVSYVKKYRLLQDVLATAALFV